MGFSSETDVVGIDNLATQAGYGSGGILEILVKSIKKMTFDDLHYADDLRRRDVMELPNYHHRDDALKVWDATYDYISDMVDLFYFSEQDVNDDYELQDWVSDTFTNGFGKLSN